MHLSFENALDMVASQLSVPPNQHEAFLLDATILTNYINNSLKERKSMFAGSFTNLPSTATYVCGDVVDIPEDFNCYLLLDLKFPFYTEMKKDGYTYLHSKCKKDKLGKSIIPSIYLQTHLRNDLYALLGVQPTIKFLEQTYTLCYHTTSYPISQHTIVATQLYTKPTACIIFEFLVGIKLEIPTYPRPLNVDMPKSMSGMKMGYWVALPVPHFDVNFNSHSYFGRCHVWQLASEKQRVHWRLVVRLAYKLSIGNGTVNTIGIHSLKHTCISICERYGLNEAERGLDNKLFDMLLTHGTLKLTEVSIAHKTGHIISFEVHPTLSSDCIKTDLLLDKMKSKMNSEHGVDYDEFKLLFGLFKQEPKNCYI